MRKYAVVPSHTINDYVWNVYEYATDHIVETFFFEEDAEDRAEFMEHGGAFDGFTPKFMTVTVKTKKDLNEAFAQEFMV